MSFWDMFGIVVVGGLMIGYSVKGFRKEMYWIGGMFAMVSIHYIVKMVVAVLGTL